METTISTDQRIINTLLLNASFIDNLGLMHGKMGISIFFYQLARQTNNQIYEDYAGELIDEIYGEITINTPVDFENGLAGIAWGIEYLVQNGFIEADTDEVLEEFDNRVFKELIYNTPKNIGLLNGLLGIGAYLLKRIQNPQSNDDKISTLTNKQLLIHLIDELDRKTKNISELITEPHKLSNEVKQYQTKETTETTSNSHQTIPNNFKQTSNTQTIKTTGTNEIIGTIETSSPHFDLLWDFPALLWFLAELYAQNIFNFKVEKIIKRLIEPLSNENNISKLQSNRLFLALALTKLNQTIETNPQTTETIETKGTTLTDSTNIKQIQIPSAKLIASICGETILCELPTNNKSLRYGSAGIAWIYRQLSKYSDEDTFRQESQHWIEKTNNSADLDFNQNYNDIMNELKSLGLLEGFAGQKLASGLLSF